MLSHKFRLPGQTSFRFAVSQTNPLFTTKTQRNNLPYNRYGFVISKKTAPKATDRNRFKRVVRSIIEENYLSYTGNDILFILKAGIKEASREEIATAITTIFSSL